MNIDTTTRLLTLYFGKYKYYISKLQVIHKYINKY